MNEEWKEIREEWKEIREEWKKFNGVRDNFDIILTNEGLHYMDKLKGKWLSLIRKKGNKEAPSLEDILNIISGHLRQKEGMINLNLKIQKKTLSIGINLEKSLDLIKDLLF
jgi:hypothetical protein